MNIFLDESSCRKLLKPFTDTRHTALIRIGILTIKEKWEKLTGLKIILSDDEKTSDSISVPANYIPTLGNHIAIIEAAKSNEALPCNDEFKCIEFPWHIFQQNDWALRKDFEMLTHNRKPQQLPASNQYNKENKIFIEQGATVSHSIINATTGPVYIGKNAQIMEGCLIRGPFSLGENSVLKMGTKIYGATTIGPYCIAGGEIKNSILFEYSNKAHDGYLGDSVIGAWCNLGAGTSNSNVKNTGSDVKFLIDKNATSVHAGNKAGLLMGDYSRSAINTSFNTGTIVGVCCNIFGEMRPGKYVPDFTWGHHRYEWEKAVQDIANWKKMKQQTSTETEIQLLYHLYQQSK